MNTSLKHIVIGVLIALGLMIIGAIGNSTPSQYEKDYESSRNKTWNEMSDGEKKVVTDEIEWYIKENG